MANSNQQPSREQPARNRRAGDLTGHSSGSSAGGRRAADEARILPRSNFAKVAMACSYLFSLGLLAWAFTLPFRSGDPTGRLDGISESDRAKLEYEARLSPEEYVQYVRRIDRKLMDQLRDRNEVRHPVPSLEDSRDVWNRRQTKHQQLLKTMRKEAGGKGFEKGTVEWEYQQELEKVRDDSPPEA